MIEQTTFSAKITKYKNNQYCSLDFSEPVSTLHSMTLLQLFSRNYKHGCGFIYKIDDEVFIC